MITVCIMSYKYGHLASHAIESVLSQSKKPDRIIFVDDGAGDCGHLPKLYGGVEYIFREKNLGIAQNFQETLEMVNTDRVLFLGADNWLRPDTLHILSQYNEDIVTYPIALFGTEAYDFARKNSLSVVHEDGYLIWTPNGVHGSSMYNVTKAKQVGYKRNPHSVKSEEDKMLFDGMLRSGASLVRINEPLLYYRRHIHNFQ